ncbi:MAG: helix-turn-helix transcriptional regulator [Rickettsiales bacterium]|nr:helix-turn-helix transcriptional regulator [Rickettsiales bacterium]
MSGIGENLRKRARELGWSDAEVARQVGISQQRYSRYVKDDREPDFATLRRICEVLELTFDEAFAQD